MPMTAAMTGTAQGMDGVVRRFVTIKADHTPCGTRAIARAAIAVFVRDTIPDDGSRVISAVIVM
jgi:hypothetical protein